MNWLGADQLTLVDVYMVGIASREARSPLKARYWVLLVSEEVTLASAYVFLTFLSRKEKSGKVRRGWGQRIR